MNSEVPLGLKGVSDTSPGIFEAGEQIWGYLPGLRSLSQRSHFGRGLFAVISQLAIAMAIVSDFAMAEKLAIAREHMQMWSVGFATYGLWSSCSATAQQREQPSTPKLAQLSGQYNLDPNLSSVY